jgi:hypothetical protein
VVSVHCSLLTADCSQFTVLCSAILFIQYSIFTAVLPDDAGFYAINEIKNKTKVKSMIAYTYNLNYGWIDEILDSF